MFLKPSTEIEKMKRKSRKRKKTCVSLPSINAGSSYKTSTTKKRHKNKLPWKQNVVDANTPDPACYKVSNVTHLLKSILPAIQR